MSRRPSGLRQRELRDGFVVPALCAGAFFAELLGAPQANLGRLDADLRLLRLTLGVHPRREQIGPGAGQADLVGAVL